MNKVAIISAYQEELKPLVNGWRPLPLENAWQAYSAWRGRVGEAACIAVSAGMGKEAAARACAIAESLSEGLDALVSLGWAGALSHEVHPSRCYVVREVIDADSRERFLTDHLPLAASPIKLVTVGHVAQAPEKRRLAEEFHAVLADMEAAAVAKIAQDKKLHFYCFKAVSDGYDEVLPDFSEYSDARGRIRVPALLAHVAVRPKYWPAMARMRKNTAAGAEALGVALRNFFENMQTIPNRLQKGT